MSLLQRGQIDAAWRSCRAHLDRHRADANGWHLLGVIEQQRGDIDQALQAMAQAQALGATAAPQLANHAGVLNIAGCHADALALASRALETAPQAPAALINAGIAAAALAQYQQALDWLKAGLNQRPQAFSARLAAVRCALALDQEDRALALAGGDNVLADRQLATQLLAVFPLRGSCKPRLRLLDQVLAQHPGHIPFVYDQAVALHTAGLGGEAIEPARTVLARHPDNDDAALMLATALLERGRIGEALDGLRALLQRVPAHDLAWSTYLVALHYDPALQPKDLLAEHQRWASLRLHGIQPRAVREVLRNPEPNRALRIGWLSPRLLTGAVTRFFDGVIGAFAPGFARHVVLHDNAASDAATHSLQAQADEWHPVQDCDDDQLEQRLLALRLDVLIDLAGHTPRNRLRVLARRVAPIQAVWIDCFDTTAVPAIDLIFLDEQMVPAGSERWYSERVVRLQPTRLAYSAPIDGPECSWQGELDAPLTLGCFNRMPKRQDGVFDCYAQLLNAIPQARFVLLDTATEGAQTRAHIEDMFVRRGVDLSRVQLLGRQSYFDLLEHYRRIDVVIDPFPFSGCTTACDALWMGVPVLTQPAATAVSRQAASILTALGQPQWICADQAGLMQALMSLANDPTRRTALRAKLRARMIRDVCDPVPVVASLQVSLRDHWRALCTGIDTTGR